MQQIENPPYLTPDYIIPIIPPVEDPEFLVKTRNYVERITSINKTDRAEVEQLRRNVRNMEAELKDLRADWHKGSGTRKNIFDDNSAYKCELDFPDDEDLSKLNIPTLQNIKLGDKLEN